MKQIKLFLILSFLLLIMIGCKKEDQVSLVYGMEEVTGLENVEAEVTTKKELPL